MAVDCTNCDKDMHGERVHCEKCYAEVMGLQEVVVKVSISPEDVTGFDNLGFEPTQRHVEIAAELMEEEYNENFYGRLFDCLLAARRYAEEEE